MNKILTKSEQIPRPRPFLYMRGFRAAASEEKGQFFVQNRISPKRDKILCIIGKRKHGIPKKPTKMFKNGKIAERAFFGTRKFKR